MALTEEQKKKLAQSMTPRPPEGFTADNGQEQEIPPPPEGFTLDVEHDNSFKRSLAQALIGFNTIASNVIGTPGEIVNPIYEKLAGRGNKILPNRKDVKEFSGIGENVPDLEPRTKLERALNRGGELTAETMAMLLPVKGAARSATAYTRANPASLTAQTSGKQIRQGIASDMAASAGTKKALAAETISGFGAGVGEQVASEASDGDQMAKDAGALGGAVTPAAIATVAKYTPTSAMLRGGKWIVNRFSPSSRATAVRVQEANKKVGQMVGELSPVEQANINEAAALSKDIKGFHPSLGEATNAPAIKAQQSALEANLSGPALEKNFANREANIKAVGDFVERSAPKDNGENIEFVMDEGNNKLIDIRDRISAAKDVVTGKRQELAAGIPKIDQAALGADFRNKIIDRRREVSKEMSVIADELGINDADITVQVSEKFDSIFNELNKTGFFRDTKNVPPILAKMKKAAELARPTEGFESYIDPLLGRQQRKVMQPGKPFTFKDLKDLRERVSDDLLDAVTGANPSRAKIRNLTQLKKMVDDSVNDLTFEGDPELAGRYKEFREIYLNEYISKFENNAAFRVRQNNQRSFFKTVDEKVAGQFFSKGNVTDARQFKSIFNNDPEANQLMAATIIDDMRGKVITDGVIDPKKYAKWREDYSSVLAEFPEIDKAIGGVGAANDMLISRNMQLDGRMKVLESNSLFKELQAASSAMQAKTPEQVVTKLMKDPRKMRSFMSIIKTNPSATSALKRHVWDGATNVDAKQMYKYITTNEKSLTVALGEKHVNDLKKIHKAMIILDRVPSPQGKGMSTNPISAITEKTLGVPAQELQNAVYRWHIGFVNKRYVVAQLFGKMFQGKSQKAFEAALTEALYDPDIASLMATGGDTGKRASIEQVKKLNAYLLALGVDPYLSDDEEKTPEAPKETQAEILKRLNIPEPPEGFTLDNNQ